MEPPSVEPLLQSFGSDAGALTDLKEHTSRSERAFNFVWR